MTEEPDFWYRAKDNRYAAYYPWTEYDQPEGGDLRVQVFRYPVVRYTPRGVRLENGVFVLGTALRQFAQPTVELALTDLVARKERHVKGARARLRQAEDHLAAALRARDSGKFSAQWPRTKEEKA